MKLIPVNEAKLPELLEMLEQNPTEESPMLKLDKILSRSLTKNWRNLSMLKTFHKRGFDDYVYWANHDIKTFNRINRLFQSIERDGILNGLGKPEKLTNRKGYSRRIDEKNRLIYDVEDGILIIIACKGHYD